MILSEMLVNDLSQNKIHGQRIFVVGLKQEVFDGKPKYIVSEPGIQYEINRETLTMIEVGDNEVQYFIDQMQELGPIQAIRDQVGLEPFSGFLETGLTFRHKDRPELMVSVKLGSGPVTGYNPNVYNRLWDLVMYGYYDVSRQSDLEYREVEQEMNLIDALTNQNFNRYGYLNVEDESPIPEDANTTPPVNEDKDYSNFFKKLCS